MPSLPSYIPPRDTDLVTWADNFSTLITASPGTYGLVAGDAVAIAGVTAAWDAAYALVANPSTKTPVAVAAKVTAKVNLLATVRPYSQQIANNAGVSSGNKVALGLNPRTSVPTPITAPTTAPALTIVSALPLQHVIRFRDATASPSVKAKPYGVTAIQIFAKASGGPTISGGDGPDNVPIVASATKSPLVVTWDSSLIGQTAFYWSRWVTRKGLVGPASPVASFTIAG